MVRSTCMGWALVGRRSDALLHAGGQLVAVAEPCSNCVELGLGREALVPEEENGFLERGLGGELADRDPDVFEDALDAVDEADVGFGGDDALESLG
jgi:hypothetical protein